MGFNNKALFYLTVLVCPISSPALTNKNLLNELKRQSATAGLGLVRVQSNWLEVIAFDSSTKALPNPQYASRVWLSPSSDFLAWVIAKERNQGQAVCTGPILITASDGTQIWQVPSGFSSIQTVGVASNGKRVVIEGRATVRKADTGETDTIHGIFYAQQGNPAVTLVKRLLPMNITGLSWSPDNRAFTYDSEDHIYVYDLTTKSEREVASGSVPAWSPDGEWIAFKSVEGEAVAINQRTMARRSLFPHRKIAWGVHWSPDSRYVMVAEKLSVAGSLLRGRVALKGPPVRIVVIRMEDGASVALGGFVFEGSNDRGFYWVADYRVFERAAQESLDVNACSKDVLIH